MPRELKEAGDGVAVGAVSAVSDRQRPSGVGGHQLDLDAFLRRGRSRTVVGAGGEDLAQGSEPWQYVPELQQGVGEAVVHKRYGDSFEDTDLEDVLAAAGVGHLVVAGAQTDECIRSTIHGAMVRGYDVTLVADAHTTEDLSEYGAPTPDKVIAHTNLYWQYHRAPGRTAAVQKTDEVTF